MAAPNTTPISSRVGDIQWINPGVTANTATDGTGTVAVVFVADATNGGRLERIKVRHLGNNPANVIRFFVNNGSTNATAANNSLLTELTLPVIAASATLALTDNDVTFYPSTSALSGIVLPPGYRILATMGSNATAGYSLIGIGGKY